MQSCKIVDVVNVERGRDNPVLMNFQNAEMGYKNDSQIHCFRADDVDRAADDGQKGGSRMAVMVSDRQVYRGYLNEGLPTDLMNTYVAVRSKKTGKMRLIQVEECHMLNACFDDNKNKLQEQESSLTVMRKFGGKVAIRALERIERSGSNIDVMNETIGETVEQYDDESFLEDTGFEKNKVEGELILASMKPPRNLEAKTPAEMYLLKDMLPKALLESLKASGMKLMGWDPETLELANIYLTNKVKAALQCKEPDSEENIQTLQICIFMDALCRVLTMRGRSMEKVLFSPFCKDLEKEVRKMFSQINHHKQIRTKYSEHKAMMYYLALAFMLEGGTFNIDHVHAGLSISKNDLLKFASAIGGSFNSVKNTLTLRLGSSGESGRTSFSGKRRFGRRK